jgi:hypothetical protein
MRTHFPVAPSDYSQGFLNRFIQDLRAYFNNAVSQDEETPRVILRSPSGKLFNVTVSDSGGLIVTPTEKQRV